MVPLGGTPVYPLKTGITDYSDEGAFLVTHGGRLAI
ncbi:hypothetical protein O185_22770 [Photorhabdus temperata J3]|uniref:Uncharacterized protein n=1 Tax=Photorhabdus temperata J3 TaxID=1389415 RepID=U7QU36_PHOTE|nr:hypothetical protein O185_22770 [Photorhabdus temperata J3]